MKNSILHFFYGIFIFTCITFQPLETFSSCSDKDNSSHGTGRTSSALKRPPSNETFPNPKRHAPSFTPEEVETLLLTNFPELRTKLEKEEIIDILATIAQSYKAGACGLEYDKLAMEELRDFLLETRSRYALFLAGKKQKGDERNHQPQRQSNTLTKGH